MRQKTKLALTLGLASGLLLAGFFIAQERGREAPEKTPPSTPPLGVAVEHGETVLQLSQKAQARLGLEVKPLEAVAPRKQIQAAAVVLPVDELVDLRDAYVAAESKLEQARAKATVAEQEYKRLESLYADNQNASLKAVQAAEGEWRASRAAEHAAQQELALASLGAKQHWGRVVAGWLERDAPELERVLDRRAMLVQVTLPPGANLVRPGRAQLETLNGKFLEAGLVSPFPRTDPRIQGISLLYRTPASPEIAPGVTVAALMPQGPALRGTVVPSSAVVWKDGRSWAYLETAAGRFTRREIGTDFPLNGGYFVQNLAPGDRIVVRGAEALLSAEAGPRQPAGEADED
jgi:hypothetical protein